MEIIEILAGVAVGMSESEMLQVTAEGRIDMWEKHYWQIIKGKTAKFISACCECGAALGGASKDVRRSLAEYGMQLGIAFQITDDVLDIAGNPNKTGKEIGNDLINGKYTLPVLYALPKIDSEVKETLLNACRNGLTRSEAKRIAALVVEAGGADMARSAAFECVQKAKSQLEVLEPSKYKDALDEIASSIVIRDV